MVPGLSQAGKDQSQPCGQGGEAQKHKGTGGARIEGQGRPQGQAPGGREDPGWGHGKATPGPRLGA